MTTLLSAFPGHAGRRWTLLRRRSVARIPAVRPRGPDEAGADPEMLNLLRWHGTEEVEHRSVAFDAYVAAGGGYLRRVAAMLGVFVGMFSVWIVATGHLLRRGYPWLRIPQRTGRRTARRRRPERLGRAP